MERFESLLLAPATILGARKNLSNLVLDFATYLWDTTLADTFSAVK